MMDLSLQLQLRQQLAMTPQLQQAIRLLQLSTPELQQEIQQMLEQNPLLEAVDESMEPLEVDLDDWQLEEFATELSDEPTISAEHSRTSTEPNEWLFQGESEETLRDYLYWQLRFAHFDEVESAIATAIIDAIDDSGYLSVELSEIQSGLGFQASLARIEGVLQRVQNFDPIGVAARSVQESLLLQLKPIAPRRVGYRLAERVLSEHIELLRSRDYRALTKKLSCSEQELKDALDLIATLQPRPGSVLATTSAPYIQPDLCVINRAGVWVVEPLDGGVPSLRLNQEYLTLLAQTDETKAYLSEQLQAAKNFLKGLEVRQQTLLKVASAIVVRQQRFFDLGAAAMEPLTLAEIAEAIGMHESTVSRVTTQKYLYTSHGVLELKYFFSSHVNRDDGGECSATAIQAHIQRLIAAENPAKPLSDHKIADLLAEMGILVARRTIAKYREALWIPPSNQRKRLV